MSEKKGKVEPMVREYTIPLGRVIVAPRHRRAKRAINIIKEFVNRHMKSSEIKIDTRVNEEIWRRGIGNPPRRIRVRLSKDEDGVVTVSRTSE